MGLKPASSSQAHSFKHFPLCIIYFSSFCLKHPSHLYTLSTVPSLYSYFLQSKQIICHFHSSNSVPKYFSSLFLCCLNSSSSIPPCPLISCLILYYLWCQLGLFSSHSSPLTLCSPKNTSYQSTHFLSLYCLFFPPHSMHPSFFHTSLFFSLSSPLAVPPWQRA